MATYKVLEFKEDTGQLVIEFAAGMAPLYIDIPIENGAYITGDALETYVNGFIPTWHIERLAAINAGVSNVEVLKNLVPQTASVEIPTVLTPDQEQAAANAKMWEELAFERSIAKVLVKFGLLESDPTQVPVSAQ